MRNPRWGSRIAQQIALAFAVDIDKDVVRRVLATHYRPAPRSGGPSWLTFLGHANDSLWSIDLFRCESATLRSHWVLVVMDHYTRCLRRSLLIGQLHLYNRGGHEESHPPVHLSHEPDRWDGVRYLRV